jgi:hypothetical protein
MTTSAHGPISERNREIMNKLAKVLDTILQKQGFVLLVFDKDVSGGRVNYISNCQRDGIVTAMKELIARFEGRYQETTTKQ